MKKHGFTLVELLAVIVILAVILAIAVPSIAGLITNSTISSFSSDAKMIIKAIRNKKMADNSFEITTLNETNIESTLGISASNYQSILVTTLKGEPYVVIVGKNKWANLLAYGIFMKVKVSDSSEYATVINQLGYDEDKGVNEPKLVAGMTPIKWNGASWIDTDISDNDWYNYDTTDKKWANARTTDGSMWVWIPRYVYKISTGWHSNVTGTVALQFSKGKDDNWNNGLIGNIDMGTTSNASNNKWTNQPAFTFDTTALMGIWVAKFEATIDGGVANGYTADGSCPIAGDNVTTKAIKVLPNVVSWRCATIGNTFIAIRKMESISAYGWKTASGLQANGTFTTDDNNIDTHLMKNVEWGAISYLSKSIYGQDTNEIYINNARNYMTGCAGNTASADDYNGCQNSYESPIGVKASTTGNIYGIYDLSGGTWERISAYVDNANGNLAGQGSSIISAASKYKDVYAKGSLDDQATNYALAINLKGDTIYETSNNISGSYSWLNDFSLMPCGAFPWIIRGGYWDTTTNAGAFAISASQGITSSFHGARPILLVDDEL